MSEKLFDRPTAPETPESTVTYQIYPRSYMDANGDGIGDLKGITQRRSHLDSSGLDVDAIWINPVYKHGNVDGGYDISDHTAIAEDLGTEEDMIELITAYGERGIKVVLDVVLNHTSDRHRWFEQSCEDPEGEFGNYYIWVDPKKIEPGEPQLPENVVAGDGDNNRIKGLPAEYAVPNNWTSIFSTSELDKLKEQYGGIIPDGVEVPAITAWVWHPGRQQFYLAEFAKEQPSLKWANPKVREAQLDVLHYWLDRGISEFRVDVGNHFAKADLDGKDPELYNEPLVPDGQYDKNVDNPHDRWTQQYMVSYEPVLKPYTLEMLSVRDEEKYRGMNVQFTIEDWTIAMAGGIKHDDTSRWRPEAAGVFNFARLLITDMANWNAATHKRVIDEYHVAYTTDPSLRGGTPKEADGNHDVKRKATQLEDPRIDRASALIKMSLPGNVFLYYGEELGLPNVPYAEMVKQGKISADRLKDTKNAGRDGQRGPMLWSKDENAGFSQAAPDELWLPVDPEYVNRHAEDQKKDPRSCYSLYRALLHMRRHSKELRHIGYTPLETDHSNVFAFGRPHPTESRQMITVTNFSGETTEVALLNTGQALARVAISSEYGLAHDRHDIVELDRGRITLGPYEALLLEPAA